MKVFSNVAAAAVLLTVSTMASAALPPKYLAIDGVQACLGEVAKDAATFVCVPKAKPAACGAASWKKLKALKGKEKVPACPAASPMTGMKAPM